MRRPSAVVTVALVTACLAAGCGDGTDDETPVACLNGPAIFLQPERGSVPVSDCLAENQTGGDLAMVGAAMVEAATKLNAEARRERGGTAAVRLGYLLGAAHRGAEETEGIHADLLRRLDAAARYSPTGGGRGAAAFQTAYERGYDAGFERG